MLNGTALNTRSILMEVYNTTFINADFAHGTRWRSCSPRVTVVFAAAYAVAFGRSTT